MVRIGNSKMKNITSICIAIILLLSSLAKANEILTECPTTKSNKQSAHFVFGFIDKGNPSPDEFRREAGMLHVTFTYNHPNAPDIPPTINAFLICEYSDKSEISIPIPGRLERCGVSGRELAQKPKVKMKWIRAWCASTPL
jgi:hypothetical protein